jgi:hypothetical protein
MNYEQKYKEALSWMQSLYKWMGIAIKEDAEHYFPELTESEDERIRKELLYWLKSKDGQTLPIDRYNAAIAWLEKKDEQKPIDYNEELKKCRENPLYFFDKYVKLKFKPKFKVKYAGSEYNILEVKDIAGEIFYGIEDEPKHIDYVKAENCEIISGYTIKENGSPYPTKPAVFSKQNPIDKTAPKFHKEEWAVNQFGYIRQIIDIKDDYYYCRSNDKGYWTISIEYADRYWHKWTINDAKDGDVLSCNDGHGNDCIELIKSITGKKIEFWFCLTNGNSYEVFDGITPYTNVASRKDATPATKEQRDLLFQKMHDAGYKWDAEKKELKKIHVIDEGKDEIDRNFTEMMLKDHTKQKPVSNWRSIDAEYMNKLCEIIDEYNVETTTKCCWKNWLKSLKDRVQLKKR